MIFASHGHALALIQHKATSSSVSSSPMAAPPSARASTRIRTRWHRVPITPGSSSASSPATWRFIIPTTACSLNADASPSMPIAQVAYSAGSNLITLGGSASQSLAVSRTLSFFHPSDLAPTGSFHGINHYQGHLPLSVNHRSGHLLTQQSPPQLWHFRDQPLAEMWPGSDEGWSCHFFSDTTLLARGKGGFRTRSTCRIHGLPSRPVRLLRKATPSAPSTSPAGLIATAYSRNNLTTPGAVLSLWQATRRRVTEMWSRPAVAGRRNDGTMHLDFDESGNASCARCLRLAAISSSTTPAPAKCSTIRTRSLQSRLRRRTRHLIAISSELQPTTRKRAPSPSSTRRMAASSPRSITTAPSTPSPPRPTAASSPSAGPTTSS
jgi:hypothetical protein